MDWKDERQILVWANRDGLGEHYFLMTDQSQERELFCPDLLKHDGHCSYSPDRRWMLTDEGDRDVRGRRVVLVRLSDEKRFDIGSFYSLPHLKGDVRCDLHPRWNRTGTQVCIDTSHSGTRQIYVIDVSSLVEKE
jgi:hypothetical protein